MALLTSAAPNSRMLKRKDDRLIFLKTLAVKLNKMRENQPVVFSAFLPATADGWRDARNR